MTFAGLKGLQAANTSLYRGERINTLLVERFDRAFDEQTHRFRRLPMLSGLTLLDAEWKARKHPDWQYAALADELYRRGAPDVDRHELYRRMAYNVLVGNADDHPRNHAVIWKEGGLEVIADVRRTAHSGRRACSGTCHVSRHRRVAAQPRQSAQSACSLCLEQGTSRGGAGRGGRLGSRSA
ncbi:hypothetical protein PSYJA_15407 [Pseudomonas syringae pv. japonica str. M301072]|uniref:HipA-like C-terminal domain-containing protein n=1 Tax=Pseudomonas syringae pv. japonica str. M301072 TaxID=629262 RepID=F3FJ96_PSESX|nr:hypothetical protein PSYJA_15407 [Pseudomonas syringae pv. japonica str. M301072]